jgi:hypothetical protein
MMARRLLSGVPRRALSVAARRTDKSQAQLFPDASTFHFKTVELPDVISDAMLARLDSKSGINVPPKHGSLSSGILLDMRCVC